VAWIESHQEIGQHPKTKRAARALQVSVPQVVGHLHLLWHWALDFAEDGELGDFDQEEIADAALWEGDPETFVDALIGCGVGDRVGYLDRDELGRLVLHDWYDYAGRLVEQRKQKGEKVKRNRNLYGDYELVHEVRERDGDHCRYCGKTVDWKDRRGKDGGTYDHIDPEGPNAPDNIVVCCRSCNSSKGARTPDEAQMPLVEPGKSDLPETYQKPAYPTVPNRTVPKEKSPDGLSSNRRPDGAVREVFAYWQERLNHPHAKISPDRKRKIAARLKEGESVERLKQAIDGCASSSFNMGENDAGRKYDSVELIFRNAGKVEEFCCLADGGRPGERQQQDPRAKEERIRRARETLESGDEDLARNFVASDEEWRVVLGEAS